jgi:hypothetical protein
VGVVSRSGWSKLELKIEYDGKERVLHFEKCRDVTNYIIDNKDGFSVSYEKGYFENAPSYAELINLKQILQRIRKVANELSINPPEFIIELLPETSVAHCLVDRNNVVLVSFPIKFQGKKIQDIDEHLIYHELMHSKEKLDGRFPSIGQLNGQDDYKELLIGRLNDFANEGKLEALGKPHQPKENAIQSIFECLKQDCYEFGDIPVEKMELLTIDVITSLCNKVWGNDLTYTQAKDILEQTIGK